MLTGIEETGGGTLTATVSFTSRQSPSDSIDESASTTGSSPVFLRAAGQRVRHDGRPGRIPGQLHRLLIGAGPRPLARPRVPAGQVSDVSDEGMTGVVARISSWSNRVMTVSTVRSQEKTGISPAPARTAHRRRGGDCGAGRPRRLRAGEPAGSTARWPSRPRRPCAGGATADRRYRAKRSAWSTSGPGSSPGW